MGLSLNKQSSKIVVYLAGRMADAEDEKWRTDITPLLESLNMEVLNPYFLEPAQLKGFKLNRLPDGCKHWYDLRNQKDERSYARFKKYMKAIIFYDMNIVAHVADIVIVRWSANCKTGCGSHAEITQALLSNKPVYCVEEAPLPAWAEACVEKKFKTFDELRTFLQDEFGGDEKVEGFKHG